MPLVDRDYLTTVWGIRLSNGLSFGSDAPLQDRHTFDLSGRLTEISYEEQEEEQANVTLTLQNNDLAYFDDALLMKGDLFSLSLGYPDEMTGLIFCFVTEVNGFETITIKADVIEGDFDWTVKTKNWGETTISNIAEAISKSNGFTKSIVENITVVKEYTQYQQSDKQFLIEEGGKFGLILTVGMEQGIPTLHLHKRRLGLRSTKEFVWYGGKGLLKAFDIVENSILGMAQQIDYYGYDPITRKPVLGTASSGATDKQDSLGKKTDMVGFINVETGRDGLLNGKAGAGSTKQKKATKEVSTTQDTDLGCKAEADGDYQNTQLELIKAKATIVGDPSIKTGDIITISGVPTFLSGSYYISAVSHKWGSSGFTTDLSLLRDAYGNSNLGADASATSQGKPNTKKPGDDGALNARGLVAVETGRDSRVYTKRD